MMADAEVMRHLGGQPLAREEAWRKLLNGAGLWSLFGYGYWAVERRSDGEMLGQVGFADFKRDMTPVIEGIPEAGWLLGRAAFGQGYATEAVRAALDWADAALCANEIVAIINAGNSASIRVAEKCGFGPPEPARYKGEPILLFRRSPSGAR
jgi:RimJ/RimL family protein N-acetyltransferase